MREHITNPIVQEKKYSVYVKQQVLAAARRVTLSDRDFVPEPTFRDRFGGRYEVHSPNRRSMEAMLSGTSWLTGNTEQDTATLNSRLATKVSLEELAAIFELDQDIQFRSLQDAVEIYDGINLFIRSGGVEDQSFDLNDMTNSEYADQLRPTLETIRDRLVPLYNKVKTSQDTATTMSWMGKVVGVKLNVGANQYEEVEDDHDNSTAVFASDVNSPTSHNPNGIQTKRKTLDFGGW